MISVAKTVSDLVGEQDWRALPNLRAMIRTTGRAFEGAVERVAPKLVDERHEVVAMVRRGPAAFPRVIVRAATEVRSLAG